MDIKKILYDHKAWVESGGEDGKRADLSGANLIDADLSGANLSDADLRRAEMFGTSGNPSEIKSIMLCDEYPITYISAYLQIGCQRHEISSWWDFDDKKIIEMGGKKALKFWREWKDTLKIIIEKSPAKPTGREGEE